MIAIIDYKAGNLQSVKNALDSLNIENTVTSDKSEISSCEGMILPGVGAFADAVKALKEYELWEFLKEYSGKKPLFGICLGMQLLFEKSYEFGENEGLGLLKGYVDKIDFKQGLKVPHMGWNSLSFVNASPIMEGVGEKDAFYFVHSYKANPQENDLIAYAEYGEKIPACVGRQNIFGSQFHPEKSGSAGLRMLKNFEKLCKKGGC